MKLSKYIESPPRLYRMLFPGTVWKSPQKDGKCVYLTFDDGPIPQITPWVLDILEEEGVKATFFMVGENAMKHPDIYQQIISKGHAVGNHTHNHLQGVKSGTRTFLKNIRLANKHIQSKLFRPPHGHMRLIQTLLIRRNYKIIMWDIVTRDYSNKQTPKGIIETIQKHTRNGSIIVFHDSLKAETNLKASLAIAIRWLKHEGYVFLTLA